MSHPSRSPWLVSVLFLLIPVALWILSCDSDGVTPNCPPDGGDCITPPGDANPNTSDGGPN